MDDSFVQYGPYRRAGTLLDTLDLPACPPTHRSEDNSGTKKTQGTSTRERRHAFRRQQRAGWRVSLCKFTSSHKESPAEIPNLNDWETKGSRQVSPLHIGTLKAAIRYDKTALELRPYIVTVCLIR